MKHGVTARFGDLPGGFRPGESGADNVYGGRQSLFSLETRYPVRTMRLWIGVLLLAMASGCGSRSGEDEESEDYVEFHVRSSAPDKYDAEYTAGGGARFQIELGGNGQGAFVASPNSKPATLIADLCRVLEAVNCPAPASQRDQRLAFHYTELARAASREDQAESGDWRYLRVFFGEDEDSEIEFLLKLGAKDGIGEFRLGNSDSGDAVMRRLVRVL